MGRKVEKLLYLPSLLYNNKYQTDRTSINNWVKVRIKRNAPLLLIKVFPTKCFKDTTDQ